MRILGVDPGTRVVGYGCLELEEDRPSRVSSEDLPLALRVNNLGRAGRGGLQVVGSGVLRLGRSDPIQNRLGRLSEEIRALLTRLRPDELALEEAFAGKSVQSALRLGESRGVIMAEAARAGVEVSQFAPARIKRSVTGSGAAGKDQVAYMVVHTLGLKRAPDTTDESDALAVGLCCVAAKGSFLI